MEGVPAIVGGRREVKAFKVYLNYLNYEGSQQAEGRLLHRLVVNQFIVLLYSYFSRFYEIGALHMKYKYLENSIFKLPILKASSLTYLSLHFSFFATL